MFPLENKSFVIDSMDFDIIEDDDETATLAPLRISILHSEYQINLQDRFKAIATDLEKIPSIEAKHPDLAAAVQAHGDVIKKQSNSREIRKAADRFIKHQKGIFGMTNAGSAVELEQRASMPEADIEADIVGNEWRLLARIHTYKERDREFAAMAKKYYKEKSGGKLICEACDLDPAARYGPAGERCIEAHHKIPIEELHPDSVTRVEEMAMVCANCHRIIHTKKPCLTVAEVRLLRP